MIRIIAFLMKAKCQCLARVMDCNQTRTTSKRYTQRTTDRHLGCKTYQSLCDKKHRKMFNLIEYLSLLR